MKIDLIHLPQALDSWADNRVEIIEICHDALKQGFVRGDYKELVQLALVYHRDPAPVEKLTKLAQPGACHRAQWMAKIIYACKVVFLSKSKVKILNRGQLPKLERFLQFIMYVYLPWWLTAPVASDAPANDLDLINKLLRYSKVDSLMAKKVLNKFKRHLWYLTQEMVPLSLFSSTISDEVKKQMSSKILECAKDRAGDKRIGTGYGKPVHPLMPDSVNEDLTWFIGPGSISFFEITHVDSSFLTKLVHTWQFDPSYTEARTMVANLAVTNDAAERGVKLCADFKGSVKSERNLQTILQTVQNERNKRPNMRNMKEEPTGWFLAIN